MISLMQSPGVCLITANPRSSTEDTVLLAVDAEQIYILMDSFITSRKFRPIKTRTYKISQAVLFDRHLLAHRHHKAQIGRKKSHFKLIFVFTH